MKQQCVHLLMKPLMDKRSKLINKLDSLNPYQMDERSKVATDLNSIDIEMQVFKENIPGDEFLFGVRNRTDIDWVYISLHSFSGQRDAADCRLHWQNYLHPSINNQPWSNKEVDHLFATVQKHKVCELTCTNFYYFPPVFNMKGKSSTQSGTFFNLNVPIVWAMPRFWIWFFKSLN